MREEGNTLLGQEERTELQSPHSNPTTLPDAIRQTCHALGVDHDVADQVVAGTLTRYTPTVEDIIRSVEPRAIVSTRYYVTSYPLMPDGQYGPQRTKAQADTLAAAITSAYPESSVTENRGTVAAWLHVDLGEDCEANIFFDHEGTPCTRV